MPVWLDDFLWSYGSLIYGVGVNAILGLSMYAVLALGQLSLGQAAFMGIGAYTGAVLTLKFGAPFALALTAAMATPAIAALVIGVPTLRLTGVYLAIATISFGEVVRILYVNTDYLGGALGLSGIPEKANGWIIFGALAVILAGFVMASRSKIGRAFEAIREDEDAARIMGIDVTAYKMWTLVLSAALAGLAGVTRTITIGPLVSNIVLRSPAMLARQALTVAELSGGRLDLGIGTASATGWGCDLSRDYVRINAHYRT